MKVYYVGGYGRSGSTTLGRALAARHGALCVGEVAVLADRELLSTAICSCGESFPGCAYWAAVHGALTAGDDAGVSRAVGAVEGLPGLLLPMSLLRRLVTSRWFSPRYPRASYAQGLATLICCAQGRLVDTSKTTRKTANRPRLIKAAGMDVELWMTWRPLREVIGSHRNAQRRRGRGGSWWRSAVAVVPSRAVALIAARWCAVSLRTHLRTSTLDQTLALVAALEGSPPNEHLIDGNRSRHETL